METFKKPPEQARKKIVSEIKTLPFVTGLKESSSKIANPNFYLIIDIRQELIKEKDSIAKLYFLLNSQSFFKWTVRLITIF